MSNNDSTLWNRNFVQCCISYFLMNLSFYMLMPTMPLYLAEALRLDVSHIGIVLSSYTVGLILVRPFSGFLVDCFSRKPLYLFAFMIFAIMFAGYFFAVAMLSIMIVRFIQGGFMGMTSVAGNTIAIDVIPSKRRGEGMGYYGLTINLAMSLAPLLAIFIYDEYGFMAVVAIGMTLALAGVVSVTLIKYPRRQTSVRPPFSFDRFVLLNALPAAFAYILVAIPYGMIVSFVVLYGKSINIEKPSLFFLFMAIGVGVSRLVSGRLVDRGKIHYVSISSQICLFITFLLFASVHQTLIFYLCALFIGIGFGVGVPAFQCLFVNVAPHHMRGTATSTFLTSFDIGVGVGMLLGGFISSHFGYSSAYFASAFFCLCSMCVYIFRVRKSYNKNRLL